MVGAGGDIGLKPGAGLKGPERLADQVEVKRPSASNPVTKLAILCAVLGAMMAVGSLLQVDVSIGAWAGGLRVSDVQKGSGLEAREGNLVRAHYKGMLPDGTVIVDTHERGSHQWRVGDGTVIVGMDRAVRGMRPGGIRRATVPYTLHYGQFGYGNKVPPHTTLTFEIEVLDVATGPWIKSPNERR